MNPGISAEEGGPFSERGVPVAPRALHFGHGVELRGFSDAPSDDLRAALEELIVDLERTFGLRRRELLAQRPKFRSRLSRGALPEFDPASQRIRDGDWAVAPPPPDLRDRRVEITGPTDRKMVVHALNSGASTYMADFEDAHSPTWDGTLRGQRNLVDAVRRTIQFVSADGQSNALGPAPATLLLRPRGLHLGEDHVRVDGRPVSASLFDFGLFAHWNGRELVRRGSGVYVYLPKLEDAAEAALWNDIFDHTERAIGLPARSIRATVLIETLPAVFQMDEILFALRERSTGLNSGRWDYIFSFIKQLRDDPRFVLPERRYLTMDTPFLRAYAEELVRTCHRRGASAIGGMAAEVPARGDDAANAQAFARITADKEREWRQGYDGTWVAHPGLVPIARAVFDRDRQAPGRPDGGDGPATPGDLLTVPPGEVSEAGLRANVRASLRYLEAWLRGTGAVALDHRMEDAATVEICRAQLWQWRHHGSRMADGRRVTSELLRSVVAAEVVDLLRAGPVPLERSRSVRTAGDLLDTVVTGREFVDFLTIPAYQALLRLAR